jgi:cytochrome b involved in lipid metabolism
MELLLSRPLIVERLCIGGNVMNKLEAEKYDDDSSLAETASVDSIDGVPDASSFLMPVHQLLGQKGICETSKMMCHSCRQRVMKRGTLSSSAGEVFYTRCQVRTHDNDSSCWLVAGNSIYDATSLLKSHPGGKECILRKAGGVEDCAMDIYFHSQRGREMWKRHRIGRLIECGEEIPSANPQWWMFWAKE